MSDADTALAQTPRIGRLFRLQYESAQEAWVLLYPEGMVKLNLPAAEILRRCDGARSARAIIEELEQAFSSPGLTEDVLAFLDMARARSWIET
jgi:pyrroloquinoline quinone biosynthesis protein D